jgi:hypothetical protein
MAAGRQAGGGKAWLAAAYEQKGDGQWKEWVLERRHPVHPTVKSTDIDGHGDLDIVAGCFVIQYRPDQKLHSPWLEVWENQRRR